jgi:hypothetical protein
MSESVREKIKAICELPWPYFFSFICDYPFPFDIKKLSGPDMYLGYFVLLILGIDVMVTLFK